ncbi:MAG: tRNA preQ1(34) S-adenosylmethionine ribosyltransferase-isomerase QueA [Patescibacteria group bacterium]|nr:tRNA preQ1(34) S-adenosylmethionine ribosyltransferase-isomerase QueA [Patescibacteria group bacterium]
MLTKDFWYELPQERIAQKPIRPRDHSKMMVLTCSSQKIEHKHFFDLPEFLRPGDLLIWNDTKVFRARLSATSNATPSVILAEAGIQYDKINSTRSPGLRRTSPEDDKKKETKERLFEVFLLRPQGENWLALVKPGKKLNLNDELLFADDVKAALIEKLPDGSVLLRFNISNEQVFAFADSHGQVPTPPYVKQFESLDDYQTVYAEKTGSAAAPTAGFHFTPELIEKLKKQNINFASVTLHVGLGTFRPVMAETLEEHVMHEEWIDVPQETVDAIKATKSRGGRVIAVGTTTVRALESLPLTKGSRGDHRGFTSIFIKPGDKFNVVDAMITNFHLPESTLVVLVSAFAQHRMNKRGTPYDVRGTEDAGRSFVLNAYREAIANDYRFYSFGDAMFIN